MPYVQKTVDCGNVKFVKKYFSTRHNTKGQICRSKSVNKTSAAQETVNDRNKEERFAILANANFGEGDYFVTFTYRRENRPESIDVARKQWNRVLRRLRNAYKKNSAQMKYLWCLEHKKVAYHFHLLCNNAVSSLIFTSAWEYGGVNIQHLDDRKYHTVGEYMMKEQFVKEDKPSTKSKRCYGSSRNLIRPEPEIVVLKDNNWEAVPQVEEGYELIEDSLEDGEIIIEDLNFNYNCQSYVLRYKPNDELLQELKEINPYTRFNKKTDRVILLEELRILKGDA